MGMILFTFSRGGGVKIEPKGFVGRTCHEATKPYERALEGDKTTRAAVDRTAVETTQEQQQQQRLQ